MRPQNGLDILSKTHKIGTMVRRDCLLWHNPNASIILCSPHWNAPVCIITTPASCHHEVLASVQMHAWQMLISVSEILSKPTYYVLGLQLLRSVGQDTAHFQYGFSSIQAVSFKLLRGFTDLQPTRQLNIFILLGSRTIGLKNSCLPIVTVDVQNNGTQ